VKSTDTRGLREIVARTRIFPELVSGHFRLTASAARITLNAGQPSTCDEDRSSAPAAPAAVEEDCVLAVEAEYGSTKHSEGDFR
jgi:hypothetical protein